MLEQYDAALESWIEESVNNSDDDALFASIKLIAGSSLLTKVLADFLSVIYLLTLVLKTRNEIIHKHVVLHYQKPLTNDKIL